MYRASVWGPSGAYISLYQISCLHMSRRISRQVISTPRMYRYGRLMLCLTRGPHLRIFPSKPSKMNPPSSSALAISKQTRSPNLTKLTGGFDHCTYDRNMSLRLFGVRGKLGGRLEESV